MSDIDPESLCTSSDELDVGGTVHARPLIASRISEPARDQYSPASSTLPKDLPDGLPEGNSPIQKRRRVTRACDECRRKKIKCNGKQPCTHCTVYSYQCTYDQPSNRRRNPAPQHVEALEARLHKAEELLKSFIPDADLNDLLKTESSTPSIDKSNLPDSDLKTGNGPAHPHPLSEIVDDDKDSDAFMETMVDATGQLDIDDEGNPDFHGQSSGIVFLRKVREQFGDMMGNAEGFGQLFLKRTYIGPNVRSPTSVNRSSLDDASPGKRELPPKECATLLCDIALNDACALMRFVHQPSFWVEFHRVYEIGIENLDDAGNRFLPLLLSMLALGTLFAKVARSKLQSMGYEKAMEQGFGWFCASRDMLNLTDLRDLTSLQAVLFLVLYLQCSSRLSTCYAYIGILTRSAARMGLHRSLSTKFDPIEQQIRKRVFWTIIKMDIYIGALLGLPMGIDHDEMDQDLAFEVDDEYITSEKVSQQPPEKMSLMCACNAHTRLVLILKKIMRNVYPITKGLESANHGDKGYMVSFAKVREIEKDLECWRETLPEPLRPGSEAPPDTVRTQQLLRMAYAHLQLFLYRPFLHYATVQPRSKHLDERCYGCAAACVNISRNIIHITTSMKEGGLLNGAYWFYMYTTFLAVLSLVYYVLGNPKGPDSEGALRDAFEGKDNLKALAKTSLAADKCTETLAGLFQELPERWKSLRGRLEPKKKRPVGSAVSSSEMTTRRAQIKPGKQTPVARGTTVTPKDSTTKNRADWAPPPIQAPTQWNERIPSGVPIDPTDFSSAIPIQSASVNQPALSLQEQVPNLNTMMFPSPDPFAYPNAPMTIFESQQLKQERLYSSNVPPSSDPRQTANNALSPTFGGMDAQTFGPLPPYLMQAQQPGVDFQEMIAGIDTNDTSVGSSNVGQIWYPQGSNTTSPAQDPSITETAADGYHSWMGHAYRGQQ